MGFSLLIRDCGIPYRLDLVGIFYKVLYGTEGGYKPL